MYEDIKRYIYIYVCVHVYVYVTIYVYMCMYMCIYLNYRLKPKNLEPRHLDAEGCFHSHGGTQDEAET